MDLNKMAYPDTFIIGKTEYKGRRKKATNEVDIPYTEEPDIGIGDKITQKSGKREIILKVLDVSFQEGGTLNVGTKHSNMLNLNIENITAHSHSKAKESVTNYHFGSISGEQIQIGNKNSQIKNVTIEQLVEHVLKSDDKAAKSKLRELLENNTVAGLLGAGASKVLELF